MIILLVVLIATSSRSGGGVASRAFEYTGYNYSSTQGDPEADKEADVWTTAKTSTVFWALIQSTLNREEIGG